MSGYGNPQDFPKDLSVFLEQSMLNWLRHQHSVFTSALEGREDRVVVELSDSFLASLKVRFSEARDPIEKDMVSIYGMKVRANPSLGHYDYKFLAERDLKVGEE